MGGVKSFKDKNERDARKQLIEELFDDFHRSRWQIYWMNFFRGIFFGFGMLIGSTIVVAILIWVLNQFTGIFPAIGDYTSQITDMIQHIKQ